jgi:FkbM family methyltransferase
MKKARPSIVRRLYKILLTLDKPYENLLFSRFATKSTFCRLANVRSFFSSMLGKGYKVKFTFEKHSGIFTISDDDHIIKAHHEKLALWSYQRGIVNRAEQMGEIYHLENIKFTDGDVVVDCGANVGDLALYFKQYKYDVEYIGIEPAPLEYECLIQNVAPMKCHNVGLWHKDGSIDFYLAGQKGDSSFIEPRNLDAVVKVKTVRLDQLIDRKIKLLKIEAEGGEPEVLIGAENLLPKIEFISADLGFERGPTAESTLVPVMNFLMQRNFELVSISHQRVVALFRNKSFS